MTVKVRLKQVSLKGRVNLLKGKIYDKFVRPRVDAKQEKLTETKLRKMLQYMKAIIETIDEGVGVTMSRKEKKQFWGDFCKYGTMRVDVFESLVKDTDIQKMLEDYYAADYQGSEKT